MASASRDRTAAAATREAIQLILRYYFGELRYQKVTVYVAEFNDASIKLHEGLGLHTEGRLRHVVYTGGTTISSCSGCSPENSERNFPPHESRARYGHVRHRQ